MTDTLDTTTVAATVERQKLQRHFGRFDILFFLICTIAAGAAVRGTGRGVPGGGRAVLLRANVFSGVVARGPRPSRM
jgi:hypothetical protein